MFSADLLAKAEALITLFTNRHLTLATAESCTGGLVAALLTSIAGSSHVLERGFVTYSNRSKHECLGVDSTLLETFGAVSRETAAAMAEGVLTHAPVDIAMSITGIAGPGGGSTAKPVGLVYFGCGSRNAIEVLEQRFGDIGRTEVRMASVAVALDMLAKAAESRR
jgi:nicotinamide-nucleotide amidase